MNISGLYIITDNNHDHRLAERVEAARLEAESANAPQPLPDGDTATADRRNEARVELTMIDRERVERLQREVRDLQTQLRQQRQLARAVWLQRIRSRLARLTAAGRKPLGEISPKGL